MAEAGHLAGREPDTIAIELARRGRKDSLLFEWLGSDDPKKRMEALDILVVRMRRLEPLAEHLERGGKLGKKARSAEGLNIRRANDGLEAIREAGLEDDGAVRAASEILERASRLYEESVRRS